METCNKIIIEQEHTYIYNKKEKSIKTNDLKIPPLVQNS